MSSATSSGRRVQRRPWRRISSRDGAEVRPDQSNYWARNPQVTAQSPRRQKQVFVIDCGRV